MTTTTSNKPPVAKVRVGLITANVWARQIDRRTFYSVKLERRYKDKDGKWQSTDSIDTPDIQNARKALDRAHDEILKLEGADAEIQSNTGEGA